MDRTETEEEGKYLVLYDASYHDRLAGALFYKVRTLMKEEGIIRIHKSVFLAPNKKAARLLAKLLPGSVKIFKVVEEVVE